MVELTRIGDRVTGEKLVATGRKIGRVLVISGTGAHRTQRAFVWGSPAWCAIDKPVRRL